jgi:hypothetical protein
MRVKLTRFGGHLIVAHTEVFSESIIEQGGCAVESAADLHR